MSTPSALHSKKTPSWGTPEQIVEIARELLGGIDLDPCSSEIFNQTVRARRYIDLQENGLTSLWRLDPSPMPQLMTLDPISVFLNPPGGVVRPFWDRLMTHVGDGSVRCAFWVGFSVEQLCTLADHEFHPLDFSTCILRKRVSFTSEDPAKKIGAPSHGNYVTAIGVDRDAFDRAFVNLGKVLHGSLT